MLSAYTQRRLRHSAFLVMCSLADEIFNFVFASVDTVAPKDVASDNGVEKRPYFCTKKASARSNGVKDKCKLVYITTKRELFNSRAHIHPPNLSGLFCGLRMKNLTDLILFSRPSAETYCVFLWRHDKIRFDSYLILFTLFHWQEQKSAKGSGVRGLWDNEGFYNFFPLKHVWT